MIHLTQRASFRGVAAFLRRSIGREAFTFAAANMPQDNRGKAFGSSTVSTKNRPKQKILKIA
jgi:hypothetical protein